MNKLSSSVYELHDNFHESCETLHTFTNRVRIMIDDLHTDSDYLAIQGKQLLKGKHPDYVDTFFKGKTIEEITELTEHFAEEANRFAVNYPVTFENMVFIYLVAIFDAFFEDLTETILIHAPNMLEANTCDQHHTQIAKEMKNKFSGRLRTQVEYWKSKFNITIEASGVKFDSINLMFEKRHVLVHRNGIVDDKFIKNTESEIYTKGDRIRIDPQDFSRSLNELRKVADYLVQQVVYKFC